VNIALTFLLTVFLLTPDKANWCRMIFLGASDKSYFCLLIHRTQPGSHYALYDSVYVARFSNVDNILEDRRLIRAWARTTPNDQPLETDTALAFDIATYLVGHHLRNQFPSDDLDKYDFTFFDGRLYLLSGHHRSLLADSTTLCKSQEWLLPLTQRTPKEWLALHLKGLLSQARVVEYFRTNTYYYFVIRAGPESGDTNFLQFIVPIPEATVAEIVKEFRKKE
jgi:hypothetical protein